VEREPVLRSVDGSVALRRIAHESINAGVPETVVELGGTDTYPLFSPAARALATGLAGWGLEEAAFVTELVVSELVTNAIRYGQEPVQLRLVRDRTLSCEVPTAATLPRTCAAPGPSTRAAAASYWSLSSPGAGAPARRREARRSGRSSPCQ
jgi:hypothetical protein